MTFPVSVVDLSTGENTKGDATMRTLLILAFLAVAAGAGMKSAPEPAPKVANVDGEAVIPGKLIGAKPMFEVKNVQFWDGKLATTGAQCTIDTGDEWNMTEGDGWAVDVEVEKPGALRFARTASVVVRRRRSL